MPRRALHRFGQRQQPVRVGVGRRTRASAGTRRCASASVMFGSFGNEACQTVHGLAGHVQHPAHVPNRGPSRQRAERRDVRDPLGAVPFTHVGQQLVTAGVAHVHVDVGHLHALGIEKSLEDESVGQRVHVGDVQAIRNEAARGRAPARADGNVELPGPLHDIGDEQEVIGQARLADDGQLVV